ncbi:hypothetical protein EV659_1165 [Rhodothalassium salexigens DSM 2132]|uniref:Phage major tail tube protein n=1 Tax=Rhodothalassium salexigens DSM 2132 TaxID=1188247 RepID=A0A4R2P5B2_RHOSA|nr:phage major tail tube protein [Rhodothalassium salexigens]MBB4212768.1 hypothetical protein [Rhodothalassium salexigens DSM 2132]MBK1638971.1 phage major tail tube protein [Rhodothalassium salexigens DSM 2132]TCP30040.1 hypothetical protein EV659_1165 [Rhodothalassium salexigens DSM 2132]
MTTQPLLLKSGTVFIDTIDYSGRMTNQTLPVPTLVTESFRGGGMDGSVEVDMGLEPLEATIELGGIEKAVLKLFGQPDVGVTMRGSFSRQGGEQATPGRANLRGLIKSPDLGAWKPGEQTQTTLTLAVHYYKLTLAGETIWEIDVPGGKRIVGGQDQLAAHRQALGI